MDAAFLLALALPLPVGRDPLGMLLAPLFLIVGMFVPPLPLTVAHDLAIEGIGLQLLAMIGSASLALAGCGIQKPTTSAPAAVAAVDKRSRRDKPGFV